MAGLGWDIWVFATAVTLAAGFVKGVVGFAMPMIMISGLATLLPPDLALAILILPTLATNTWQAMRGGLRAAYRAAQSHWRYLVMVLICIAGSSQLFFMLSETVIFLILGLPVTLFAAFQLAGWRLRFPPHARRWVELTVGAFAGIIGGLSGVWGPPTVAYLTALDTQKVEQVRVQGVVYSAGAVMLLLAHINSGVITWPNAQASALMLIPALLGMAVGFRVQDRLDQVLFRRLTLIVLIIAGLNLVRRALFG